MARHVMGGVVGSVALGASLSGCLFSYDAASTDVKYVNQSRQDVAVIIEGMNDEFPMPVASKSSFREPIDECRGTSIRVESADGSLVGRIDEPGCPNWTLTINEDGSLDYVED